MCPFLLSLWLVEKSPFFTFANDFLLSFYVGKNILGLLVSHSITETTCEVDSVFISFLLFCSF